MDFLKLGINLNAQILLWIEMIIMLVTLVETWWCYLAVQSGPLIEHYFEKLFIDLNQ